MKVAIIGLGHRGLATLKRWLSYPQATVVAVCDSDPSRFTAVEQLPGSGHLACYEDWERLACESEATLLIICTPRHTHAEMACRAMELGRDVAVEVPAATTLEECRRIVETTGRTGRFFTMLENCCYDPFSLFTEQLVGEGALGEITHCEGAYLHDVTARPGFVADMRRDGPGNVYPTHGIGPVCRILGVGRTDEFVGLESMSPSVKGATINSTLLLTRLGRTVLLQMDLTTPRPYSRLQTVCGTLGYVSKYPVEVVQLVGQEPLYGEALEKFMSEHRHPWVAAYEEDGRAAGVDNMMNYIMDRRLIHVYTNGLAPDITAADAALWCSLTPLTAANVAGRNSESI